MLRLLFSLPRLLLLPSALSECASAVAEADITKEVRPGVCFGCRWSWFSKGSTASRCFHCSCSWYGKGYTPLFPEVFRYYGSKSRQHSYIFVFLSFVYEEFFRVYLEFFQNRKCIWTASCAHQWFFILFSFSRESICMPVGADLVCFSSETFLHAIFAVWPSGASQEACVNPSYTYAYLAEFRVQIAVLKKAYIYLCKTSDIHRTISGSALVNIHTLPTCRGI